MNDTNEDLLITAVVRAEWFDYRDPDCCVAPIVRATFGTTDLSQVLGILISEERYLYGDAVPEVGPGKDWRRMTAAEATGDAGTLEVCRRLEVVSRRAQAREEHWRENDARIAHLEGASRA